MFNLVSGTNETRHIEWHEMYKCKCTFSSSVCNNKQCWNDDKCSCESKELIDKGISIPNLFGIQVIVSANVINPVILVSI